MSGIEARIAKVLGAHVKGWWKSDGTYREMRCRECNHLTVGNASLDDLERAHQAAMLAPVIAGVWDEGAFDASMSLDHGGHNADNPYRSAP